MRYILVVIEKSSKVNAFSVPTRFCMIGEELSVDSFQ